MCSVDLIKIGSETPMRRGLELERRDQKEGKKKKKKKIQGKAGKKQAVLSSSSLLQWEAVSQNLSSRAGVCLQKKINPRGKEVDAGWIDQNSFVNLPKHGHPKL